MNSGFYVLFQSALIGSTTDYAICILVVFLFGAFLTWATFVLNRLEKWALRQNNFSGAAIGALSKSICLALAYFGMLIAMTFNIGQASNYRFFFFIKHTLYQQ